LSGSPPSSAPWLLTGATGFLGRHLLEAIARSGSPHPVIALLRDPGEWDRMDWTRSLTRVRLLQGSVTAPETWSADPQLDGLAGIFHLAALVRHSRSDAELVQRTNVAGTLHLVRLAARHRARMIFVSSSGTVGCFRTPGETADEAAPYCEQEVSGWPYYRSKVAAEREARSLAATLGVDLVIVRPPVLLGPGDHRFRSTNYIRRYLRGRIPFLIRGGMHFADVRDVALALLRAMELPTARPVYHLPGTMCTLHEFYQRVAALAGGSPPRVTLPFRPAWLLATLNQQLGLTLLPEPSLVEMAAHYWGTSSRYAGELDYHNRAADETLRDTIEWLRTHEEAAE
jgi:nucleoside-diphosphate-sugar epimerase